MSAEDGPLLEARGIFKYFGAITALRDVNFHVSAGEVLGIVGDYRWVGERLLSALDFWPASRTIDALDLTPQGLHNFDVICLNLDRPEKSSGSLANKITDMTTHVTLILQQLLTLFIPVFVSCLLANVFLAQVNLFFACALTIWIVAHFTRESRCAFSMARMVGRAAAGVHSR